MANPVDWPVGVPSCIMPLSPQGGLRDNRLSFDTDSKMNPIERPAASWTPEIYSVELTPLSVAQFEEFQRWYADDLRFGALPFYWSHPITGEPGVWKIQKADPPYRVSKRGLIPDGSNRRRVNLSFTIMSVPMDYGTSIIGSLFSNGQAGFWADTFAPASKRVYKETNVIIAAAGETARIVMGRLSGEAEQATALSRPTLVRWPKGGRRNLLTRTGAMNISPWVTLNSTVTAAPDEPQAPSGVFKLVPASGTVGYVSQSFTGSDTEATFSFYAKAGEKHTVSFITNLTGAFRSVVFNLLLGSASTAIGWTAQITAVGDGWYRCSASTTVAISATSDLRIGNNSAGWTGDGVSGVLVSAPQFVAGLVATPYQLVGTANDITEEGVPDVWHLFNDGGDSLPITLPAGTYGLASWNEVGQLTIGTVVDPADVLIAPRMAGVIVRAGAFSVSEQAKIVNYVESLDLS